MRDLPCSNELLKLSFVKLWKVSKWSYLSKSRANYKVSAKNIFKLKLNTAPNLCLPAKQLDIQAKWKACLCRLCLVKLQSDSHVEVTLLASQPENGTNVMLEIYDTASDLDSELILATCHIMCSLMPQS